MKKFAIILIIILAALWLAASCRYEDLGLGSALAEETELQNQADQSEISNEEFFFQLKNKQKIQNPLADINIRKAILYAIDRKEIVQQLMGDYNAALDSLFSENSPYYHPAWEMYDYDLEAARESLAKAGYSEDKPLYLTLGIGMESGARQKIAEMIKEDLEQIGIYVWVTDQSSDDWYSNIVKNGEYELGIWALFNYDGSSLESYFSSNKIPPLETEQNQNCNNFYWYNNQDVDKLLTTLGYTQDQDKKEELFIQIQEKLAGDAVILPLFSRLYVVAHNSRIEGISINLENGSVLADMEKWNIDSEEEEETVVVGYQEEPAAISPFVDNTLFNKYINEVLFMGLWSRNSSGSYDNLLVKDYKVIDSLQLNTPNQIVSVQLREDIYWENGNPITSEDVYHTWQAVVNSDAVVTNGMDYSVIENIEVKSDTQFDIVFNKFPDGWQDLFRFLLPAEGLQQYEMTLNLYDDFVFANGPYRLAEWIRGEYILLEANEHFFGPQPGVKYIKFRFNSDTNNLINALEAQDIDVLSIPFDLELVQEIEENEDISLIVEKGNLWEHLAFSLKPR